jgi:hypothetical protein
MRLRLALGVAPLLLSACGVGETLPGSGMIDGLDLGMELGLDVRELEIAEVQPDVRLLGRVAQLSGHDARSFSRIYTGQTRLGSSDVSLRIAVVALQDGGRLAVAVDDQGIVRATGLWGTPSFDSDADGTWETFCFQFHGRPLLLRAEETLDPVAAEGYWADLQRDTSPDAEIARALYRHRLLMASNGQLLRATMRRTARGDLPPWDWFRKWKEIYGEVGALSEPLRGLIGDRAAERHHALAEETSRRLEAVLAAVSTQEPSSVRSLLSGEFSREACAACHGITSERLGGEGIHDGIRRRLRELGVRHDLGRVGRDLWGVPGQEDNSERVAVGFKTCFLLLGETPTS